MIWWAWIVLGIALLVVEMVTPGGMFALFFGLAALAVGLLAMLGYAGPFWLEWLIFAALSLISLAAFRRRLLQSIRRGTPEVDRLVGEVAMPVAALEPDAFGKAELRGTVWEARNVGDSRVEAGQRCRVEGIDGLLLLIRA